MMDSVMILIATTGQQDAYGVWRESETQRQVYCKVDSVTRAEFFEGGRNGLNPEFKFTVFSADYHGEALCEYCGNRYGIYRTYRVPGNDYMELYAERKGGTNG